jgi:ABC-type multidrug transport system fused ATPase/permease subunit
MVGGTALAISDLSAWHEQLAWVPQRPTIFRGTVAENIRLGAREAPDDAIVAAALLAGAHEFVLGLPRGYETVVGDGGRPLSAGERRRIALARAFLRPTPLLVLDEPTADLDPESEAIVAAALERLRGERTILLITHRDELAQVADRVAVLSGGRCVERDVVAA